MKEKEIILNTSSTNFTPENKTTAPENTVQFNSIASENTPAATPEYSTLEQPRRRRGAAPTRKTKTPKTRPVKEDNSGRRLPVWKIVLLSMLSVFLVSALTLGTLAAIYWDASMGGQVVNDAAAEAQDAIVGDKVTVLLVGTDRVASNTDTIMLVTFDTKTKELNMISIPRDTRVPSGRSYAKVNSIYNARGMAGLIKQVKELTGIPINFYAMVDTKAFREVVDVLGGVEFNVPYNMEYHDPLQNLHISLRKGKQMLNGKKAEQLVRFRSMGEADLTRGDVQRDFISAMIQQHATIANVPKIGEIFNAILPNLETTITYGDAISYGTALAGISSGSIKSHRLPGKAMYVGDISYYIADADAAKELAISLGFDGEGIKRIPLPSNASTTPPETIPEDEILGDGSEEDETEEDETDEEKEEDEDKASDKDKDTNADKDKDSNKDKDTGKDKDKDKDTSKEDEDEEDKKETNEKPSSSDDGKEEDKPKEPSDPKEEYPDGI